MSILKKHILYAEQKDQIKIIDLPNYIKIILLNLGNLIINIGVTFMYF